MHVLLTYKVATKQLEIEKAQATPKPRKLYKNLKIFTKNMCKKGIWLPPLADTPKSHNVLIGSQEGTTKNKHKNTKHKTTNNTKIYTNYHTNPKHKLTQATIKSHIYT